jgi:transposase
VKRIDMLFAIEREVNGLSADERRQVRQERSRPLRALRGFALGRKAWLFAGSSRGAERAATMATLIQTTKMNDVDPQAWLADVLARVAGHPVHRLHELLPWTWRSKSTIAIAA